MLLTIVAIIAFAKRKTIDGIQYESKGDNTAVAILTIQAKGDVVIKESVEIGSMRCLVVEVSEAYFIYDVNGCNAHFATSSFQARIDNAK